MQKNKMFLTTVCIALIAVALVIAACNQNNSKEETIQTSQSIGLNNQEQNENANQNINSNTDNSSLQKQNGNQQRTEYTLQTDANGKELKPNKTKREIDKSKLETKLKAGSGMSNFKELAKKNSGQNTTSSNIESNIKPANSAIDYGGIQKIVFGSFGGFSGSRTEHTIYSSGKIQKTVSLTKENIEFKVFDQDQINEIFEVFDGLDITRYDFNERGNMTYFVGAVYEEAEHYVYWGSPSFKVPIQFNEFQKAAKQFIRENNPKK